MKRDKQNAELLHQNVSNSLEMNRRDFIKKFGGGLVIAFSISELPLLAEFAAQQAQRENLNAYLRIGEDGRVTLFTGKIEMGQGPITALPMELADELDVSLENIDIIMGDTDLCPWDGGTGGSNSIRRFGQQMRSAAAEARAILLKMASKELSVSADQLMVSEGVVSVIKDKTRRISYAELTRGKKILETLSEQPPLKKASEFKYIGTSRLHVDGMVKVTGEAKYSGDIKLPGMMYAKIVRPPSLGAKLLSIDTSEAEAIKGVEIVRDGDFIAVLHESQDTADIAITKVKAEFEEDKRDVDDKSLYSYLLERGTQSSDIDSRGNLQEGEKQSGKSFDLEYHDPYIAHAPLETHTGTAVFEGDKLKIWASCQSPFPAQSEVAKVLGIPEENVRVMQIFVGGGFGGKLPNYHAVEVARLAKLSGKPVQLVYSRAEEFLLDRLRPAAVVKIRSGLDKAGNICFWDYNIYFGGSRGAAHFYDIPHSRTRIFQDPKGTDSHLFYTGAWRGPSNNTNTFARESHIDIMAAAAGVDPLEFRLRHLEGNPKMAEVLRVAAEKFGWTPARGPSGRGYGISCGIDAGTTITVFVEVDVDKSTGHVQVKRAVCVQNMGMVANRQGSIIQSEGCIIMGLAYALSEEVRFEGRKMLTQNFSDYEITRFSWTPEIDVVLIDAQDDPPQGCGEPGIINVGGAIANAIFDATGARLYQQPMTPRRVLEAIQKAE